MRVVNSEMQDFKKNITHQVSTIQPQMKHQMDAVNLELQELRDFKKNMTNHIQYQPQGLQPTNVHHNPAAQTLPTPMYPQPVLQHQWSHHPQPAY